MQEIKVFREDTKLDSRVLNGGQKFISREVYAKLRADISNPDFADLVKIVAGQVYGDTESFLTFGERRNRGDFNERSSVRVASEFGRKRLNVVKSFYTKFERKIPALIADFCAYYETHQNKTVVFYYDTTALGSNYAVNEQDFRWVVIHEFERHGWHVQDVYIGNPMKHHEKYLEINEAFAGRRKLMPFINRQNNEDLILALQTAGVSRETR